MAAKKPGKGAEGGADSELGFEQAMERLEQIVDRIEAGECGLEESIQEYERGMALIRRCRDVLARAEQRVEELGRLAGSDDATDDDASEGEEGEEGDDERA